jgi:hypothetical protein
MRCLGKPLLLLWFLRWRINFGSVYSEIRDLTLLMLGRFLLGKSFFTRLAGSGSQNLKCRHAYIGEWFFLRHAMPDRLSIRKN